MRIIEERVEQITVKTCTLHLDLEDVRQLLGQSNTKFRSIPADATMSCEGRDSEGETVYIEDVQIKITWREELNRIS